MLATHVPLLTSFFQATAGHEEAAPRNRVVVNNRAVLDCFAKHRLHLVLQGHLHVNEMLRWRGTTFITAGAVCGQWVARSLARHRRRVRRLDPAARPRGLGIQGDRLGPAPSVIR